MIVEGESLDIFELLKTGFLSSLHGMAAKWQLQQRAFCLRLHTRHYYSSFANGESVHYCDSQA